MHAKQKKRLKVIACVMTLLAIGVGLILYALKQNINLFYTPTQLITSHITSDSAIRVGGYVKEHSVHYDASGERVSFVITDRSHDVSVYYRGVLPNLFREGQGVVITGKRMTEDTLEASQVLAKHDEKYMPPMVKKALQQRTRGQYDS